MHIWPSNVSQETNLALNSERDKKRKKIQTKQTKNRVYCVRFYQQLFFSLIAGMLVSRKQVWLKVKPSSWISLTQAAPPSCI